MNVDQKNAINKEFRIHVFHMGEVDNWGWKCKIIKRSTTVYESPAYFSEDQCRVHAFEVGWKLLAYRDIIVLEAA